jgi:hypothetical protein
MIGLILEPAGPGKFRPLLDGVAITRPTRQPLLDGARALVALGYPAEAVVTARHAGSAVVAMRSTVGGAARWAVEERDQGGLRKCLWKPFQNAVSSDGGSPETTAEAEANHPAPDASRVLEAA